MRRELLINGMLAAMERGGRACGLAPGGAVAQDEDDGTAAPQATRSVVNEP